jgi:hypothetical protein
MRWWPPRPGPAGRPDAVVRQRGHGAVQERVHGRAAAAVAAGRLQSEVRPRGRQAQRPGQRRLHRAPPHLLRDAGQLQLRRLLQGTGDRARLGLDQPAVRPAARALLVTVYADDDEAAQLWRKIAGFSDDRIIRIGTSDNFWSMGDTGPCGPCSEIFFDQGPEVAGGPPGSPTRTATGSWSSGTGLHAVRPGAGRRAHAPAHALHRHRAWGSRRISAILQGVTSNYETDLFRTLIAPAWS